MREKWNHFWLRPAPPHALALVRIAFGAFLLFIVAVSYLPHLSLLFSREGIPAPLLLGRVPREIAWLVVPPEPWVVVFLAATLVLALVGLTIGYCMRLSALVTLGIGVWAWQMNLHDFTASYLRLFGFLLAVLAWSGADRTLSLRMRLRRGSWLAWEPVCMLPQRLIAAQITFTYLGVGWQKVWLPAWQGGEVLAYSFMTRWATAPARAVARWHLPILFYDAAVLLIKLFETTLPFGLWAPSVRRWYMLGGLLFHVGIAVLLGIWWFLVLPPAYVVFFSPERVRDTIESGMGELLRRVKSKR